MANQITLLCPSLVCRAVLSVPDKVRGKKIRCGKCGTHFVVPQAPRVTVPPAPPQKSAAPEEDEQTRE